MDQMKRKLLDEVLSHLDRSQGSDFKSFMDSERMPKQNPLADSEEPMEDEGALMAGNPKGLQIEKIKMTRDSDPMAEMDPSQEPLEIEEIQPGEEDQEMTDDELKELLKNALA